MLPRQVTKDYYDVIENYMKDFINGHVNHPNYIETEIDIKYDFKRIFSKR